MWRGSTCTTCRLWREPESRSSFPSLATRTPLPVAVAQQLPVASWESLVPGRRALSPVFDHIEQPSGEAPWLAPLPAKSLCLSNTLAARRKSMKKKREKRKSSWCCMNKP